MALVAAEGTADSLQLHIVKVDAIERMISYLEHLDYHGEKFGFCVRPLIEPFEKSQVGGAGARS